MGCLFSSMLPLKCDIWVQVNAQDDESGEFVRSWQYSDTVNCAMTSISTKGKDGAALEVTRYSSDVYKYESLIYLTFAKSVSENARITNVVDQSGNQLYMEPVTGNSMVFEILGKTPVLDGPFGQVWGYKYLCNRSIVQEMNNGERL